ncbi:MFS transporter [Paraburkholderia sp. SARCC-3016]|uniref:MFS transporter n=1 Tax=Paraburkholderia sp. SARCC-3016 TaxID=3058611 RepID=UPI002809E6D4|nr:MFS transporter [Paraburkholderia sp. SARCC-3016]MDQ7975956.1 MFS transporter [Paraburkholderia sp. SARCC-3016]
MNARIVSPSVPSSTDIAGSSADARRERAIYRKIAWRILPLLVFCYILNYLDRINIGIAQLQFKSDLGFSDAAYGLGAGLLFVGYVLFEIPSNLLLDRIGVRKTFLRIMVAWGVLSTMTMFVRTPMQFYIVRFLIGVAEAGFTPGIFLYLSYWFPARRRARMTSIFYLSIPIAAIVGTPLSGWIMHAFGGDLGLRGWQWLFMLEGLPSVLFGVIVYFALSDRPQQAAWLDASEQAFVLAQLAADDAQKTRRVAHQAKASALRVIARDPRVFCAGFTFACSFSLGNTLAFWAPVVIRNSGIAQVANVGVLAAIPALVGIVVMLAVGRHSDRTLERRWHAALALFAAAGALALLPHFRGDTTVALALLAVASAGHYSCLAVFWSIPPTYLPRETAAAGIALVNVIGSLGGALSTAALGWMSKGPQGFGIGLVVLGAVIACGAALLLVAFPARVLRSGAA